MVHVFKALEEASLNDPLGLHELRQPEANSKQPQSFGLWLDIALERLRLIVDPVERQIGERHIVEALQEYPDVQRHAFLVLEWCQEYRGYQTLTLWALTRIAPQALKPKLLPISSTVFKSVDEVGLRDFAISLILSATPNASMLAIRFLKKASANLSRLGGLETLSKICRESVAHVYGRLSENLEFKPSTPLDFKEAFDWRKLNETLQKYENQEQSTTRNSLSSWLSRNGFQELSNWADAEELEGGELEGREGSPLNTENDENRRVSIDDAREGIRLFRLFGISAHLQKSTNYFKEEDLELGLAESRLLGVQDGRASLKDFQDAFGRSEKGLSRQPSVEKDAFLCIKIGLEIGSPEELWALYSKHERAITYSTWNWIFDRAMVRWAKLEEKVKVPEDFVARRLMAVLAASMRIVHDENQVDADRTFAQDFLSSCDECFDVDLEKTQLGLQRWTHLTSIWREHGLEKNDRDYGIWLEESEHAASGFTPSFKGHSQKQGTLENLGQDEEMPDDAYQCFAMLESGFQWASTDEVDNTFLEEWQSFESAWAKSLSTQEDETRFVEYWNQVLQSAPESLQSKRFDLFWEMTRQPFMAKGCAHALLQERSNEVSDERVFRLCDVLERDEELHRFRQSLYIGLILNGEQAARSEALHRLGVMVDDGGQEKVVRAFFWLSSTLFQEDALKLASVCESVAKDIELEAAPELLALINFRLKLEVNEDLKDVLEAAQDTLMDRDEENALDSISPGERQGLYSWMYAMLLHSAAGMVKAKAPKGLESQLKHIDDVFIVAHDDALGQLEGFCLHSPTAANATLSSEQRGLDAKSLTFALLFSANSYSPHTKVSRETQARLRRICIAMNSSQSRDNSAHLFFLNPLTQNVIAHDFRAGDEVRDEVRDLIEGMPVGALLRSVERVQKNDRVMLFLRWAMVLNRAQRFEEAVLCLRNARTYPPSSDNIEVLLACFESLLANVDAHPNYLRELLRVRRDVLVEGYLGTPLAGESFEWVQEIFSLVRRAASNLECEGLEMGALIEGIEVLSAHSPNVHCDAIVRVLELSIQDLSGRLREPECINALRSLLPIEGAGSRELRAPLFKRVEELESRDALNLWLLQHDATTDVKVEVHQYFKGWLNNKAPGHESGSAELLLAETLVASKNDDPRARKRVLDFALLRGDTQEALKCIEDATALVPGSESGSESGPGDLATRIEIALVGRNDQLVSLLNTYLENIESQHDFDFALSVFVRGLSQGTKGLLKESLKTFVSVCENEVRAKTFLTTFQKSGLYQELKGNERAETDAQLVLMASRFDALLAEASELSRSAYANAPNEEAENILIELAGESDTMEQALSLIAETLGAMGTDQDQDQVEDSEEQYNEKSELALKYPLESARRRLLRYATLVGLEPETREQISKVVLTSKTLNDADVAAIAAFENADALRRLELVRFAQVCKHDTDEEVLLLLREFRLWGELEDEEEMLRCASLVQELLKGNSEFAENEKRSHLKKVYPELRSIYFNRGDFEGASDIVLLDIGVTPDPVERAALYCDRAFLLLQSYRQRQSGSKLRAREAEVDLFFAILESLRKARTLDPHNKSIVQMSREVESLVGIENRISLEHELIQLYEALGDLEQECSSRERWANHYFMLSGQTPAKHPFTKDDALDNILKASETMDEELGQPERALQLLGDSLVPMKADMALLSSLDVFAEDTEYRSRVVEMLRNAVESFHRSGELSLAISLQTRLVEKLPAKDAEQLEAMFHLLSLSVTAKEGELAEKVRENIFEKVSSSENTNNQKLANLQRLADSFEHDDVSPLRKAVLHQVTEEEEEFGEVTRIVDALHEELKLDPDKVESWLKLAEYQLSRDEWMKAHQSYRSALDCIANSTRADEKELSNLAYLGVGACLAREGALVLEWGTHLVELDAQKIDHNRWERDASLALKSMWAKSPSAAFDFLKKLVESLNRQEAPAQTQLSLVRESLQWLERRGEVDALLGQANLFCADVEHELGGRPFDVWRYRARYVELFPADQETRETFLEGAPDSETQELLLDAMIRATHRESTSMEMSIELNERAIEYALHALNDYDQSVKAIHVLLEREDLSKNYGKRVAKAWAELVRVERESLDRDALIESLHGQSLFLSRFHTLHSRTNEERPEEDAKVRDEDELCADGKGVKQSGSCYEPIGTSPEYFASANAQARVSAFECMMLCEERGDSLARQESRALEFLSFIPNALKVKDILIRVLIEAKQWGRARQALDDIVSANAPQNASLNVDGQDRRALLYNVTAGELGDTKAGSHLFDALFETKDGRKALRDHFDRYWVAGGDDDVLRLSLQVVDKENDAGTAAELLTHHSEKLLEHGHERRAYSWLQNLASRYEHEGEHELAFLSLSKAFRIRPGDVDTRTRLRALASKARIADAFIDLLTETGASLRSEGRLQLWGDLNEYAADVAEHDLKDPSLAIELYEEVTAALTKRSRSLKRLAELYTQERRWNDYAQHLHDRLRVSSPDRSRLNILLALADVEEQRGDEPGAIKYYRRAYELDASDPGARRALLALESKIRDHSLVRELYEREILALRQEEIPDEKAIASLRLKLASHLKDISGDPAAAIAQYEVLAQLETHRDIANTHLEGLYRSLGRRSQLDRLIRKRIDSVPPVEAARLRLELASLQTGDHSGDTQAKADLEDARTLSPGDLEILLRLLDVNRRLSFESEQAENLLALLSLYPTHRQADDWRIELLRLASECPEAVPSESYKKELGQLAENPELSAESYVELIHLSDAKTYAPIHLRLYTHLAAVSHGAQSAKAHADRGCLNEELGDSKSALRDYQNAIQIAKDDQDSWMGVRRNAEDIPDWDSWVVAQKEIIAFQADVASKKVEQLRLADVYENQMLQPELALVAYGEAWRLDYNDCSKLSTIQKLARESDNLDAYISMLQDGASAQQSHEGQVKLLAEAGRFQKALGDDRESMQSWRQILEIEPSHEKALYNAMQISLEHQRWESALKYGESWSMRAETSEARLERVYRLFDLLKHGKADYRFGDELLNKAILLGVQQLHVLQRQRQHAQDHQMWSREIEILVRQEDFLSTDAERAECLDSQAQLAELQLDDDQRAISVREKIRHLDVDPMDNLLALERLYQRSDRPRELVDVFEAMIANEQTRSVQVTLLAKLATLWDVRFEQPRKALECLERLFGIDRQHLGSWRYAEDLVEKMDDPSGRREILERAYRVVESSEDKIRIGLKLGVAFEAAVEGEQKAHGYYEDVLSFDPGSQHALAGIARTTYALGRNEDAVQAWENLGAASSEGENAAEAFVQAARISEERLRDRVRAISLYKKALQVGPKDLKVMRALHECYVSESDRANAMRWLEALASEGRGEQAARDFVSLADRLKEDTQLRKAEHALTRALKKDSSYTPAAYRLARLYFRSENWDAALPLVRQSLEDESLDLKGERRARFAYRGGYAAMKVNKTGLALEFFKVAHDEAPTMLEGAEGYARALVRKGMHEEALRVLNVILVHHRENLSQVELRDIGFQQAKLLADLKRFDESLDELEPILKNDPRNSRALDLSSEIHLQLGNYEAAHASLQRLADVSQGSERLKRIRQVATIASDELKDPYRAIEAYESARREAPGEVNILEALLSLYSETRQAENCANTLQELVRVENDDAKRSGYLYTLGKLYRDELGKNTLAVECFGNAFELDASHMKAFKAKEALIVAQEDWEGLANQYISFLKHPEVDAAQKTVVWRTLGDLYRFKIKNFAQAAQAYEVVCARLPDEHECRRVYASILSRLENRSSDSKATWLSIIASGDTIDKEALHKLSNLSLKERDFDEAFLYVSALKVMGEASPRESALYEKLSGQNTAHNAKALSSSIWREHLLLPGVKGHISQALQVLWKHGASLFLEDPRHLPKRMKGEWIDLSSPEAGFFAQSVQKIATQCGFPSVRLVRMRGRDDSVSIAGCSGQVLAVGELAPEFREHHQARLVFPVARQVGYLHPALVLARSLGRTRTLAILERLCLALDGGFPTQSLDEDLARYAKASQRLMRDERAARDLSHALEPLVAQGKALRLRAYFGALEHSVDRAALFVSGDLESSLRSMRGQLPATRYLPDWGERITHLIRFWVSDTHAKLRASHGIGISR